MRNFAGKDFTTFGAFLLCLRAQRGHGGTAKYTVRASYAKFENTYAGHENCPALKQHFCLI